jgi:hypothetical protein
MKIQLDYDSKTITIEDNVNLGEFVKKVEKILPEWKEWKLITKTEIIRSQPDTNYHPWRGIYPPNVPGWDWPHIICDTGDTKVSGRVRISDGMDTARKFEL